MRILVLLLEVVAAWLAVRRESRGRSHPLRSSKNRQLRRCRTDKLGKDWVRVRYDDKQRAAGNGIGDRALSTRRARSASDRVTGDSRPGRGRAHRRRSPTTKSSTAASKTYDAVLYELVAAEGTVVERGRGTSNAHPLGALQNGMKSMLALEHQLEKVDYTKKNFVHADMSPDQFLQAMKDRNEGFLQMYMRLLGHTLAQQSEMAAKGESPDVAIFAALFAEDRPLRLKKVLAKQLADTEELLTSFGGEEGSVLISERNKTALKVLKEQMAAGKKHIGIFYGAGHLADMDQRLREDFGLKPVEITWLTAWDLAPKP